MRGQPFKKGQVPWNKGMKMPEEHLKKLRVRRKGSGIYVRTPEMIEKFKNRVITDKHRENISKNHHDISGKNNPMYGKKHSEETRRKISEKHKIKDRTKLKMADVHSYDTRYKEWMFKIKRRDKWLCKINNKDCKGKLEAHHILSWKDYPELRYEENNGISLCHYHHPRKRSEEKRLSPYFQELINKI